MRLDKIIWRAAWKTLAAVAALFAIMVCVLVAFFPHTVMDLTDSLGMDKLSVKFAITSYERFDRVDYIAKGANVALRANLHERAEECLETLVADDGFESYCAAKDQAAGELQAGEGYRDYYYRQLCVSKYRAGKGNAAVDRAIELMGLSFSVGNPLITVVAEARADGAAGASTIDYAYEKMTEIKSGVYGGYSAQEQASFDRVYATVTAWAAQA